MSTNWVSIAAHEKGSPKQCTGAYVVLNYACNCSCVFCPISGLEPKFKSWEQIQDNIDRAADFCTCDTIEFTGGEILLHPKLPNVMQYSKDKGFKHIHFYTNGIKFSDMHVCREYKELGLNSVMLSVHGATADTHEMLMCSSKGAYDAVWAAINNLNALDIGIIVNCVVTKLNIDEIPKLLEQCASKAQAIKQLRLTYPAIEGNLDKRLDLLVSFEDIIPVVDSLNGKFQLPELRFELFPFCVLGSRVKQSVEWLDRHQSSYFEEFCSLRYRRILGKECIECTHRSTCHGFQENYIKLFGISKSLDPIAEHSALALDGVIP